MSLSQKTCPWMRVSKKARARMFRAARRSSD